MTKLTADQVASITLADVLEFVRNADQKTRRAINQEICYQFDAENREAREGFKYGDKVKFTVNKRPHFGRTFTGTVVKRNVKTIEVKPDSGGRNWRVSAAMLSKA